VRDLLRRYLRMSWEELAYGGHQVADPAPFLVRLLRHSLLVTQAEVSADPDHWPAWKPALPLSPALRPSSSPPTPATAAGSTSCPTTRRRSSTTGTTGSRCAIVRQFLGSERPYAS
jgi:hypothetical protein